MIYEIRGKQVMLASDVARLYMVETKRINEAVKRNKKDAVGRLFYFICFPKSNQEGSVPVLNHR